MARAYPAVAYPAVRASPMLCSPSGVVPLTSKSPTVRALNTAGLWVATVWALRQCRSSPLALEVAEAPHGFEELLGRAQGELGDDHLGLLDLELGEIGPPAAPRRQVRRSRAARLGCARRPARSPPAA